MRLVLLFVALVLACGAFFVTGHLMSKDKDQDKKIPVVTPAPVVREVPTVDIYTAKQDIPLGEVIKPTLLDIQPWPKHLMLEGMVEAHPDQPNDLIKMVARTPFVKGEPIITNKLANDKDPSFLPASLPKGMRAITIATDAISGVGGFVFPGDRVDVLVTHDIVLGKSEESNVTNAKPVKKDPVTEVLLPNIRVLAVNMKAAAHGGEPPTVPSNVSLEVAAGDAQKLRLAENGNGRLSLVLRSLKDKDEMELARPTGIGDLSRLTPPSYFPVLYDGAGNLASGSEDAALAGKSAITVVRGVHAEDVEVSRP